jgi:hypothetical protein
LKRRTITAVVALLATPMVLIAQESAGRRLYVVPGMHYGTPSRASFAVTAFLDGRKGVIGKGNILVLEGGRDAFKGQIGIANVSQTRLGYSAQIGYLQTRDRPIDAIPNASYAGTELHVYLSVFNLGTGFYAPLGNASGKRGLLHLSFGVGF